ncbi:rRNA pseudouridine synthase [archaeon]|nr:rRNA pseudouridine synthase [archaeon]
MAGMRINRFIASTGDVSRRKADELLREGRVSINGRQACLGDTIDPHHDEVTIDGTVIRPQKTLYLAMNKPRFVVTTMHDPEGRECIRDILPEKYSGVFPVGRLDFDAEGLLLLTNNGELANALHHPSFDVAKTYIVKVNPVAGQEQLRRMREGIELDGIMTRPAVIEHLKSHAGGSTLRITLKQGLKNQIKRMARAVGLEVSSIRRISMGPISLEDMGAGQVRELTPAEIKKLHKILK